MVAPDMLGYDETDKSQGTDRYDGELIIGDVVALVETLGLKQMDIKMTR